MTHESNRATQLKTLDELCDAFESQWQAGERPALAEFVQRAPSNQRETAFHDLLALDIEYRCDAGELPEAADYQEAFSEFADQIRAAFRETQTGRDTARCDETIDSQSDYSDARLPTHFEGYNVLEEVARGGMGVVYKAHQQSLDRIVALKVVLAGEAPSPQLVDRFIAEAKMVAKLQHPGIVTVHEVGQAEGHPFFSMEYVEGRTLSELLRDGSLSQREAARYINEIAKTIEFAHEQGILHRDIKPSNVMLDQLGRLRVMDFGLAKHVEADTNLTASGQILGTPGYMSPEQARGEHDKVDRRSDVYALGALLYSLLTGKAPFESESIAELMAQVIRDEPVGPRELKPGVDRDLERICLRCLAKQPEDRFETANELAIALETYLGRQTDQRGTRNSRGLLIAAASLVALLLVATVVITIKWGDKTVTVKTDGDTEVEVKKDRVTVRTDGKTIDVRDTDGQVSTGDSALDQLRREAIDPYELAYAGGGDPDKAPEGLVAVLGQSLGRHSDAVGDVAVSPDGETIASISQTGTVRLWDAASMRQRAEFHRHSHRRVCFSVDSSTLVTWGHNDKLCVWDVGDRPRQIASVLAFSEENEPIHSRSLVYSTQGHKIAALGYQKTQNKDLRVRVWNCDERGIPVDDGITLKVDNDTLGMAINPAGTILATGTLDGTLQFWKLSEQPELITTWNAEGAEIHQLTFAPNGKWLAAACDKKGCLVWDISNETPALKFTLSMPAGHGYRTVAFSRDSSRIASGVQYEQVHLWELSDDEASSGVRIDRPLVGGNGISGIAFTPDGHSLVCGNHDRMVRVIDITGIEPKLRFVPTEGHWSYDVEIEHVSQDGRVVFTQAKDNRLIQWKIENGRFVESAATQLSDSSLNSSVVNREGTLLAVTSPDGIADPIRLMRLTDGRAMLRNKIDTDSNIRRLAMAPSGTRLASKDVSGEVRLWDVATGDHIVVDRFAAGISGGHGVAFSTDGSLLAAAGEPAEGEARIRIWDVSESPPKHLKHLDIFSPNRVWGDLQFSPNSRLLLHSGPRFDVTDISGALPNQVFSLTSELSSHYLATFSPDGTMIAMSAGTGRHLELRDTQNFALLRKWALPARVRPKFAPDGRHLFAGNTSGTVYVLRLKERPQE